MEKKDLLEIDVATPEGVDDQVLKEILDELKLKHWDSGQNYEILDKWIWLYTTSYQHLRIQGQIHSGMDRLAVANGGDVLPDLCAGVNYSRNDGGGVIRLEKVQSHFINPDNDHDFTDLMKEELDWLQKVGDESPFNVSKNDTVSSNWKSIKKPQDNQDHHDIEFTIPLDPLLPPDQGYQIQNNAELDEHGLGLCFENQIAMFKLNFKEPLDYFDKRKIEWMEKKGRTEERRFHFLPENASSRKDTIRKENERQARKS